MERTHKQFKHKRWSAGGEQRGFLFSLWTQFIRSRLASGCKSRCLFCYFNEPWTIRMETSAPEWTVTEFRTSGKWNRHRCFCFWGFWVDNGRHTCPNRSFVILNWKDLFGNERNYLELKIFEKKLFRNDFKKTGKSFHWKHSLQPRNTESRFRHPGKRHKVCRRVQHRSHASLQQHNSNSTSQLNFICCKWWEKDEDLWAGYAST